MQVLRRASVALLIALGLGNADAQGIPVIDQAVLLQTVQQVINDIQRKQLEVRREELIAQEQALSDLYGLDRRALERLQAILGSANQPTVIVNGGTAAAIPVAPHRPAERIAVPAYDPTAEIDVFDISPGVLPPADGGTESGDAN